MRRSSLIALFVGVAASASPVLAQSPDAATAELLFQQGRDLLRAGRAAEGCPKLAESQRLDPATGTLLALAMCHEAEGKLASAWAEFLSAEQRSRADRRPDREKVARDRAQALRPKLSTLEIRVSAAAAGVQGLEVRRDGVLLGSGAWNTAVPVDGGSHSVQVTAPNKRPWNATINLKLEGDAQVIEVPELEAAPAASSGPEATAAQPISSNEAPSESWSTLEWAGVGAAGAGVVVLGVGGYFLASALGKNSDSEADCEGNVCGVQGVADRDQAISKGNTATAFGVAGGVLVGAGATLFIIGRSQRSKETASAPPRLGITAGPQGLGAQISTQF